jgi:hypothetical protein
MSAEYILRHSRKYPTNRQGVKYSKVISGAIIMLVGILVGFVLASINSD